MYSPSIFAAVPVALLLITCAHPSAALVVGDKHHILTRNKTMSAHPASKSGPPRRTRTKHVVPQAPNHRRAVDDPLSTNLDPYLNDLTLQHSNLLAASDAFSSSAQTARTNADDSSRQDTAAKLASYQQTLGPLYPLMENLGADKGLANYDKSDEYETVLKDIVNVNKSILGKVSTLVDADPLLGPVLGPIVYDIKCILDELLDYTENITDALLNPLAPLLRPLISNATSTVCRSIVPPVADLCLGV